MFKKRSSHPTSHPTSWEKVTDWYDSAVGAEGHYYHQNVIIPDLLKYWRLNSKSSVVDLGCGQGVLARHIPQKISYLGIDASPSLIKSAKQYRQNSLHRFEIGDITKPLKEGEKFSHAAIILALQNVESPEDVFKNGFHLLKEHGILSLVINHPYFRIPRQSSWGVDDNKKLQYRRIERYMSPLKIPIQTNPGKGEGNTLSFHWPLSQLSEWLEKSGFKIQRIQELCSNKESTGPKAKMENRAREEFPLFMVIHCIKN